MYVKYQPKQLHSIFILFLFLAITSAQSQTATFISYGDDWKYLDDGSDQGTAWKDPGFSDGSWASGPTEIGHSDGDEETVMQQDHICYYLRKSFNVTDPTLYPTIDMKMFYDDGAVVYVNGVEVFRVNMPSGTIEFDTKANGSENTTVTHSFASTLVTGTNVIAVSLHDRSGSSDVSFNFELKGTNTPPPPPSFDLPRGPYLQNGTPTSMVVKWRTNSSNNSAVYYGTSVSNLNQIVTDASSVTDHEIEITGLDPNTKYYYAIGTTTDTIFGNGDAENYFYTLPNFGKRDQKYRFWVLGDAGTANSNQRAVRDAYYGFTSGTYTNGIIQLGDNAYSDGTDSEYQPAMFEDMYENMLRQSVAWSTLGNHDERSTDPVAETGVYYDIYTLPTAGEAGGLPSGYEGYYSFDYGNVHFICLNSELDPDSTGTMTQWAKDDIMNTTQEWIVAFWHRPPYSKGSHDSDSEGSLEDMRRQVLPILEKYGVDLVLTGHSHSYERSYFLHGHYGSSSSLTSSMKLDETSGEHEVDCAYMKKRNSSTAGKGTVYVTAGSSGKTSSGSLDHPAMFLSLKELGSVVIDVENNRMDVIFLREDGSVDDRYAIMKNVGRSSDVYAAPGDVVNLDASWEGTYSWTTGQSTQSIAHTATSNQTVYVEDTYGCLVDTFNIILTPVGNQDLEYISNLNIYPNPISSGDIFFVEYDKTQNSAERIEVFDTQGKKLQVPMSRISDSKWAVWANLSAGVYNLKIGTQTSTIQIK